MLNDFNKIYKKIISEINNFDESNKDFYAKSIFTQMSLLIVENIFQNELKNHNIKVETLQCNVSTKKNDENIIAETCHGKSLQRKNNFIKQTYPYIFENEYCKNTIVDFEFEKNNLIPDDIELLYECVFDKTKRKDYGQFFTNNYKIIDYMLELSDYNNNIENIKVLEPSVGSGLFLARIINRLVILLKEKNFNEIEILNIINQNIFAGDIDDFACFLTQLNLLISLKDIIINAFIKSPDFLLKRFNVFKNDYTESTFFTAEKSKGQFDLIIGNPPYITMYGKRSRTMTSEKRIYYNQHYDFVIDKKKNNKFNSIMFFIEKSIKLLKDKQKITFIIDISFFETAFKDIRKYILDFCKIKNIISDLEEFNNVASGQIIIVLEKCSDELLRNNNIVEWKDENEVYFIPQINFYTVKNEYKYLKPFKEEDFEILKKIEINSKQLIELFPKKQLRTCCALTGKSDLFMVSEEEFKNDKNNLIFKYLEGSKGVKRKFATPTHSNYFKFDYNLQQFVSEEFKKELTKLGVKNKKRIALGDLKSYLSPKIFIRQCAKELIATYTEDKFASNNSIYLLSNKINTEENKKFLKYICVLINSDILTYYSQQKKIIRLEKGKTPQIKLDDLKKLPLILNNDYVELLSDLFDYENTDAEKANMYVNEIYNINEKEYLFIKKSIEEFKKK